MERRTAIQILHEGAIFSISKAREKRLTDAMDTYAQEIAVEFAEWATIETVIKNIGFIASDKVWRIWQHAPFYDGRDELTTSDLYQLFTQKNQK